MRLNQLVEHWDRNARARLFDEHLPVRLSDADEKRLSQLAEAYPLKSREDLLRDLLAAAIDEVETSFPYREGATVVARDEDGFEIYEDAGMTPRFLYLTRKYMEKMKKGENHAA